MPLTELSKKHLPTKVNWTLECHTAFESLKHALLQSNALQASDPSQSYIVQTDASQTGLSCVLVQKGADVLLQPVVFLSEKLLPKKRHLSIVEKECLALVWALAKLCVYLWGQQLVIQMDRSPLCWLSRVKNSNQKLLRWSLILQDFQFTVIHLFGEANVVADALSRVYQSKK